MDGSKFILAMAICATSLANGCVERIDTPVEATRELVVNCLLTKDSVQTMTLTYSNRLGDLMYDKVEDADARLFANGKEVGQFIRKGISYDWTLKYTPVPNTEYRLEVKAGQFPLVWATTTFPQPISIARSAYQDNVDLKKKFAIRKFMTLERTKVFWTFAFSMDDDIYINPRIRPVVIDPADKKIDYIGTSFPNVDNFNIASFNDGNYSLNQGKYLTYIRMLPNDDTTFSIYDVIIGKVVFRTPSEEYDRYLKTSLTKMMRFMKNDDPTTWLDETSVYNNINNGIGIFGAYYDIVMYCNEYSDEFPQVYVWH